ncbi:MAG: T9SS type A sorting domain-containing protein [Bacteroidetes bacterium]|nr:T9SS type A sorting domain-containing protein [Bacteroidota bacterium]
MKPFYKLLFAIFLAANFTFSTAQCLLLNVPLEKRIAESDIIIEGKVISKTSFWNEDKSRIYTSNIIELYKVFKGEISSEKIEMISDGGVVGDTWVKVNPGVELGIGETGIFLCNFYTNNSIATNKSVSYIPNCLSLGFIKYNLAELSAADVFTRYSDIKTKLYDFISQKTALSVIDYNKFNLQALQNNRAAKKQAAAAAITSFSPTTISAGSKSILTIKGSGFGATRGSNYVGFANADDGGKTWADLYDASVTFDNLYYVKWTDTEIQVYVPNRESAGGSKLVFAGTGKISVVVNTVRTVSSDTLNIKWALYEHPFTDGFSQVVHTNVNGKGGYTIHLNTAFAGNAAAVAAYTRALKNWSCATGINWDLGSNTASTTSAVDTIITVRFGNPGELPPGTMGIATSTYKTSCGTGNTRRYYLMGFDHVFTNQPSDGTNNYAWQFGPAPATNSEVDFESIVLHEFGHAHQFGHIIRPKYTMNYAVTPGETTRTIHPELVEGGNVNCAASFATPICNPTNPGPMIRSALVGATITPSADKTICSGISTTLTVSGNADSYSWSPSTGLNTTTGTSVVASPIVTTTYKITALKGASCSATSNIKVSVNQANATVGSDGAICSGDVFTLQATGGGTYTWSPATGLSSTTVANPDASPANTTTYTVTVTATNGCSANSTVSVSVFPAPPKPVITRNGNVLTSTSIDVFMYEWYKNGNIISGASNQSYTMTGSGSYYVVVTNADGCSSTSSPFLLTGIDEFSSKNIVTGYFDEIIGEIILKIYSPVKEKYIAELYNIAGQQLSHTDCGERSGTFTERIPANDLAKGIYIISIKAEGNGIKSYKKIIVE